MGGRSRSSTSRLCPSGTTSAITGLPSGAGTSILARRWSEPDGFFIALRTSGGTRELWRVATSGAATKVGTYPAPPSTVTLTANARLDRAGRLFSFGTDNTTSFIDVIVRSEVGATTDVVYSEASNPLVKIHGSSLVTGP